MVQLKVTGLDSQTNTLDASPGATVLQTLREAGYDDLLALCGGCCSCATCHVYVDPAQVDRLQPMSEDEDGLLDGTTHRREASRLSCQLRLDESLDGLHVTIAPQD